MVLSKGAEPELICLSGRRERNPVTILTSPQIQSFAFYAKGIRYAIETVLLRKPKGIFRDMHFDRPIAGADSVTPCEYRVVGYNSQ